MPDKVINIETKEKEIENILDNYSLEQNMEMLAELEGYTEVPVNIDTFIEEDEYLGKIWGGVHESGDFEGQPKVYPFWRKVLREIYPNPLLPPAYTEVCVTGAIGLGKSNIALIGMEYELYKLLLLENPHQKYGIGEVTPIVMALFTATKDLSNSVLYKGLMDTIFRSPFFKKLYQRTPNQPGIIFPHNIGVLSGSQSKHALSAAVFQGILDEANFGSHANQVLDNYNEITRRMTSRFMQGGGQLPGSFWILSSKKDTSSFLEDHINQSRSNPKVKVIEAALWEVQAHIKEKWSGVTFPVFAGDSDREPMILTKGEPVPPGIDASRIIDVPVELADKYEADLLGSLRDTAGVSTTSKFKLFRSREQLNNCLILPNAFRSDTIMLSESDDNDRIQDYLNSDFYDVKTKSVPHFIHLDAALGKTGRGGDRFGIAMCHAHSNKEIRRTDFVTGKISTFQELVVMVDFCLGIEARPGQEVAFWKVREFISFLREMGFNLGSINSQYVSRTGISTYDKRTGMGLITTDGWQSKDSLQLLRKQGFEVHELSVDRTKEPTIAFKKAVMEERVYCPKNKILEKELLHLEDTGKHIDHPERYPDGTKGCFVGDTKISLVDGREVCIKDLVDEHKRGKTNYVYTIDEQTLNISPKKILSAHMSKNVLEAIEVTIDNFEKIRCTLNHRFMLRDGSYCEAQYLKGGDSLMPLYRRVSQHHLPGYRLYYNVGDVDWHYEHRQFCEDIIPSKYIVHHKDYKKVNNSPTNLQPMSKSDHKTLHNRRQSEEERRKRSRSVKLWHELNRGTPGYEERSAKIILSMMGEDVPTEDLCANKDGKVPYLEYRKQIKEHKKESRKHRVEQQKLCNIERVKAVEKRFKQIETSKLLKLLKKIRLSKFIFENLGKSIAACTLMEKIAMGVKLSGLLDPTIKIRRAEGVHVAHKEGKFENARKALARHNETQRGVPRTDVVKQKISETHLKNKKLEMWHKSLSQKDKDLIFGKSSRGKPWYNNGTQSKQFVVGGQPDGWVKGRIKTWKNHKVVNIEKIRFSKITPVYDLTIEDNPNFALTAGVFVHNSKDIADAVIGSVWSCMENAHSSQLYSETVLSEMEDFLNDKSDFWSEKNGTFLGSMYGDSF